MSYCESDFASEFSKWLRMQRKEGNYLFSFAVEHKVCKKRRLNFTSDFQDQQLPSLYQTKHECIYYKLSDLDIGRKPYDAFTMCFEPAYIAVLWYKLRQPKTFYMVDIDKIYVFKETHKSITEEECKTLADFIITL